MVNQIVYAGLKNAIERGENFDGAIRTMIAAGYDRFEVNEAAKEVIKEYSDSETPEKPVELVSPSPVEEKEEKKEEMLSPTEEIPLQPTTIIKLKEKKSSKNILVIAIILLLALAAGLTYLLITKFI